jgi:ribonuclease P protein component
MKHIAIGENHLYSKAYNKGAKYVGKGVVIYVLKDLKANLLKKAHPDKIKVNRIGLTVTKKIGGAVIRSRVKRILREGLRQIEKEFQTKKGYLLVLVARPATAEMKSTQVAKDLEKALVALKIIDNENN